MAYMLDFMTFIQTSTPNTAFFSTLTTHVNYTCNTYEHLTYSIPDSRPKIAIFSPFEVKCTERGITHFPSLVSFQFLVHIDIRVPE